MGGEMEVLLDELAVGPVETLARLMNPSWQTSPTTGCPPDSYLNAETASWRSEARSSTSPILSHNEVAYYIGFVLIEEEEE